MSDWLVIVLAAPFASFGEEPGNARRGTTDRPTRSALIGLAGAALGVERADVAGQMALGASFRTATRTIRSGTPMTDFHTFQSLPANKGPVATRADALALRGELATSVTRRDYRTEALWQAAYTTVGGAAISLEALRDAFLRPRFALSAGRKSCVFARPLCPLLVAVGDVDAAFRAQSRRVNEAGGRAVLAESGGLIALDARGGAEPRSNASRRHRRVDDPGDRERWHFAARFEEVYPMPSVETPDGGGAE